MPFDGNKADYVNALAQPKRGPARVYDQDNPPPTMAEALRMAAKDMEAMFAQGIGYNWDICTLRQARMEGACGPCTAGAVILRMAGPDHYCWDSFIDQWVEVLMALSDISAISPNHSKINIESARLKWPQGFPPNAPRHFPIRNAAEDPQGAIDDMFACADMLDGLAQREAS